MYMGELEDNIAFRDNTEDSTVGNDSYPQNFAFNFEISPNLTAIAVTKCLMLLQYYTRQSLMKTVCRTGSRTLNSEFAMYQGK